MATNNNLHPSHRAEWLPTLTQELLLKAVLADGEKAFKLWKQWKSRIELDDADAGSQRLFPHLYRKLNDQGNTDPDLEKYKGVYRFFWYKNQMLFNVGTDMLAKFHERGIKTMILKGADLATRHYKDIGLRPMNDIDILVETERAQEALEIIQRAGFVPDERIRLRYTPAIIPLTHGFAFVNSRNHGIDLHWHVLPESCRQHSDTEFWNAAEPIEFNGVHTKALCPTDLLFHILAAGAR
ncbi:MAG TPA: nucleotidyltransferase family protein, partial [Bacteroidota bacterium]